MTVAVRGGAEADLEDTFDHYESVRPGLGHDFLFEFRRAVDRMLQFPNGWQALDHEYRRCRLHRFPYGVIYRIDPQANQIIVVAIQHLHRRPNDWRKRLGP